MAMWRVMWTTADSRGNRVPNLELFANGQRAQDYYLKICRTLGTVEARLEKLDRDWEPQQVHRAEAPE